MRPFALALAITFAASVPAHAQVESNLPGAGFTPPNAPGSAPATTLQVYSRETIVDITVTDSSGRPVHGLTRDDFTILEDGKPMSPTSFTEHRTGTPSNAAAPAPATPPLPPDTFTNIAPASPTPQNASPLNVLVLDALDTPVVTQTIVQQRMLDFAAKAAPGTQIAVLSLSATGRLAILQGFTADRNLLKAAISSAKVTGQVPPIEDSTQDISGPDWVDQNVECNSAAMRGQYTLSAMGQLARYLSGMPGRKNLIWFAGAFPLSMTDKYGATCYDFNDDLKAADDRLANAHVTLYPVDPRALDLIAKYGMRSRQVKQQIQEHLTQEAIAEDTGGHAFYNNNDLAAAVATAIDAGSNFYTLTYAPANRALDTRFRTIKVSVNRAGLHLTYRDGYYAIPPGTTLAGAKIPQLTPLQSAMLRGALEPTQILFSAKITQSPAAASTAAALPVDNHPDAKLLKPPYRVYSIALSVDVHGIQFTQTPDGNYRASFEFAVNLYNPDGDEVLNSASKTVSPILPPAVYRSMLRSGAAAHLDIAAPAAGDLFLRIAVHDLTSDQVGAIEVPTASIQSTADRPLAAAQ